MIILISPSKTLDFSSPAKDNYTTPLFIKDSCSLISELKKLSVKQICNLMSISDKLGELNFNRYHKFSRTFTTKNSREAIYAFRGDVYEGLSADSLTTKDIEYAQEHLRILSGLYGLLRPLDLIQPYRLEMGIKLANKEGKNLYQFWENKITEAIEKDSTTIINLASQEYFKAINTKVLSQKIITPIFKEKKGDSYKVIALLAKKARGLMSRYIIQNRLTKIEDIKNFSEAGYKFIPSFSDEFEWVFTR